MRNRVLSNYLVAIIVTITVLGFVVINKGESKSMNVPLPEDIKIIAPPEDLPKKIAAFSGRWEGVWDSGLEAVLIVEQINSEEARILYSWGDSPKTNTKRGYKRGVAKVIPGKRPRIEFGGGKSPKFIFTMRKDLKKIKGTRKFKGYSNRITMRKSN